MNGAQSLQYNFEKATYYLVTEYVVRRYVTLRPTNHDEHIVCCKEFMLAEHQRHLRLGECWVSTRSFEKPFYTRLSLPSSIGRMAKIEGSLEPRGFGK